MTSELVFDSIPHPGEMLGDYLEDLGWSQSELARRAGLTAKTVSEIRNGKAPISPPTALALESVLGRPAHFWLGLQRVHDEALARAARSALSVSADWHSWAKAFPLKELRALNFLDSSGDGGDDLTQILRFLGVSSPDSWDAVWRSSAVAFRQHGSRQRPSVAAWVRASELEAIDLERQLEVAPYSKDALENAVPLFRQLTTMGVSNESFGHLQTLAAACGVIVVIVPQFAGSGVSGCARWLTRSKAMIGLTFRYKTDDQLWFSFFHELGHILLHRRTLSFVLEDTDDLRRLDGVSPEVRRQEEEANRFAADTLIPPAALARLLDECPRPNASEVLAFAEQVGVSPGIVVGRLQHDGILPYSVHYGLKQEIGLGVK